MKRTAIAIAVGALSTGLSYGVIAQDEDAQLGEKQQMTEENAQGTDGDTDIRVEQEPAEIEVRQEAPDVTVEQQAPEVTIEQPDPNVEIDQAEPEVTVVQQGEAEVRVESADEASAEMRDTEQRDEDRDQRDDEEMFADQNGQDRAAQDEADRDQERDARDRGIQVSELENRDLINQDGEELGDIERVVRDTQSGDIYVIVTEGGFLGFGEDEMAYPIENLEIRSDGEVVLQSQSGERSADEFDDDNYEKLDGDVRIDVNHMN
ncbi:PRC-barrel domain-containing protein [Halomonas sp. DQ26W]|uniref:PRC-barrel domain-containing protein n=1 Tax=Halomonas sp. DQ26W TaxID=2282311 RepID=UPI0015F0D9D4|nr:PRC-barrel domain-containing protein [Halomonas sp. DQ26W]